MANSDKNILITPATDTTSEPSIQFTGGDNNDPITIRTLDDGTLSFDGSLGQLFSISNSFNGKLFSANDISGIPGIDLDDAGTVRLAPYDGNVIIGTTSITPGNEDTSLYISGIPTYANNTAASADLPVGAVYRTSTGELMVRY